MKDVFVILFAQLPAIAAITGATLMVLNNKEGWGWFLFIAVLVCASRIKTS